MPESENTTEATSAEQNQPEKPTIGQTNEPDSETHPSENDWYAPNEQQRARRAEYHDYLNVAASRIGNLPGGQIPTLYIQNANMRDFVLRESNPIDPNYIPPLQRDSAEVPKEEKDKVYQVYEEHIGYAKALSILQVSNIIVLRGNPLVGKRAAAIRLALQVNGGRFPVRVLSHEDSLFEQIERTPQDAGSVYMVDGLLQEFGKSLSSIVALNIIELLNKRKCSAIICSRLDVPFPNEFKTVTLQPLHGKTRILVEKHLRFYGVPENEIQIILNDESVSSLLQDDLPPSQADNLSRLLSDAWQAGITVNEALRGFIGAIKEEVCQWLYETEENIQETAFRLSLAVFSGVGYDSIQVAATDLASRLIGVDRLNSPSSEIKDSKPTESTYVSPLKRRATTTDRVRNARADRVPKIIVTDYSDKVEIEVIELNNPTYSAVVLQYLWLEIAEWRQPLLEWLCSYAEKSVYNLRVRAAGAIAILADTKFDEIRSRVFQPWAMTPLKDGDLRRHRYAALTSTLGMLSFIKQNDEEVLGLLRSWVSSDWLGPRWAAARVYSNVGLQHPREAFRQWRSILESEERVALRLTNTLRLYIPHPLHQSIIDAIFSLFLQAVESPNYMRPVYEQSIEGLDAWVDADKEDQNSQGYGLPLFISLMSLRVPTENSSSRDEDWPPAMLFIVSAQPDSAYRLALARLLQSSFNHPTLGTIAFSTIRDWVRCAEANRPLLQVPLTALLRETISLPSKLPKREHNRLAMYLKRWAEDPSGSLPLAHELAEELKLEIND